MTWIALLGVLRCRSIRRLINEFKLQRRRRTSHSEKDAERCRRRKEGSQQKLNEQVNDGPTQKRSLIIPIRGITLQAVPLSSSPFSMSSCSAPEMIKPIELSTCVHLIVRLPISFQISIKDFGVKIFSYFHSFSLNGRSLLNCGSVVVL